MAPVYQSDPGAAPDSDFEPGRLEHLVAGNEGRLLDARRTPVAVTAVVPETGSFELEVRAFEDAGARWLLPLEDVGDFQFALDARTASPAEVGELEAAIARFDQPLVIECAGSARRASLDRLAAERAAATDWLYAHAAPRPGLDHHIATREGDPRLYRLLHEFLGPRDLAELDRDFTRTFVSNPRSGELVKGHAIVLAELGLCPFSGKVVRDPATFDGPCSRQRRADHLVARLAFTQALWSGWGHETVTLYRGAATETEFRHRPASFVSATFSLDVAKDHFAGGAATKAARLTGQEVTVDRLLMTFLESEGMNQAFKEAEGVLLGHPHGAGF